MKETRTFNKQVPASEATIFEISGGNPNGFLLSIENQDEANTLVYHFEKSDDGGETWEDIEFAASEGDPVVTFSVIATRVHNLKVSDSSPLIRFRAYGDVSISVTVQSFRRTPVDSDNFTFSI